MAERADMMQPEDLSAARGAEMSPAAGDAAESPEALRRAIAQTRADIGRTVQEIKERVNRQHLMEQADQLRDQAVEAAREATVGRADEVVSKAGETVRGAASRAIKAIRAHPIPALLAVALLGFVAYQIRSR
ncbi:DUF3618 domain-containing protein [Nitrolancea hollandica]|uniref:DUF3618 domain-containing protein n=1 Tax=Nitrolancea hollandica Lb TaxID=1129897 RepID=I4EES8_9BACT|nr:DUF3618 domain-containing protein [Nitrolancea hollandica]CCF83190.1 hypothetical protein NITHO_200009 [Nitrolancea hollandica Lb]